MSSLNRTVLLKERSVVRKKRCHFIDKDIQDIIRPLYLIQNLFLAKSFRIEDNFIFPNSKLTNVKAFIGMFICIVLYIYRFCLVIILSVSGNIFILFLRSLFSFLYYCCGYILNFMSNICNSNINIQLILNMQTINRSIKFCDSELKSIVFWNWAYVLCLILLSVPVLGYFLTQYIIRDYIVLELICSELLILFDADIMKCIRLIYFLRCKTKIWIQTLHCKTVSQNTSKLFGNKCKFKRMIETYINILDSYDICRIIFNKMITFYTIATFFQALMCVQIMIVLLKDANSYAFGAGFMILYWFLKNMLILIVMCKEFEAFYIQVEKVSVSSIKLIESMDYKMRKGKCYKNAVRMNRFIFMKMRASGMFCVDAGLPMQMLSVLATYAIVLLQFAFL